MELFVGLILVAVVFEVYVVVVGTGAGIYYEVVGFGVGYLGLIRFNYLLDLSGFKNMRSMKF